MPPYGYMKDPDDPKRWIVDEDAAPTVRRIFQMTLEGQGIAQIAAALDRDGILTPTHYWQSKGSNHGGKKGTKSPSHWNHSTIYKILSLQEYCGDVINFKTYSKSYKNKRRFVNEEENRATTISSILTARITTTAGAGAMLPTISAWIFWNRLSCRK